MKTEAFPKQASNLELSRSMLAQRNPAWPALSVLLIAVAIFHLFFLMTTPAPFRDEGWYASRAWALIQTGRAYGSLDAGVFERFPEYWYFFFWLGTAFQAASMSLLGPSLFAMRVMSLFFGIILALVVYVIGSCLANARTGLLAAALVSLAPSFLYSSHLARQDIIVAAFGFGAIALYLTDSSKGFSSKSVLSGLAVGLTLDIHFNGMIFGPVIGALYLMDYGWRLVFAKRFWGFVAGACVGVFYFIAMHILPNPQTYFSIFSYAAGISRTPPLLSSDLGLWLNSSQEALVQMSLPSVLLVIGAFVALLRRRTQGDRKLLTIFAVLLLGYVAVLRVKELHYVILIAPAAGLLAAALLEKLFQDFGRSPSRLTTALLTIVMCLVIAFITGSLPMLRTDPTDDYRAATSHISSAIPTGSTAIGLQTWWFALQGRTYLSWEQLVYYRRSTPGSTTEDALRALRPDYLVVDRVIDWYMTDDLERLNGTFDSSAVSKTEMEEFLAKQAHLVTEVETKAYGDVRVYQIDWNKAAK